MTEKQYEYDGQVYDESALHVGDGVTAQDVEQIRALAVGESYELEGSGGAAGSLIVKRLPDVPDAKQHDGEPVDIGEHTPARNTVTTRPGTTEQKQWHTGLEDHPLAKRGKQQRPD